MSTGTTPLSQVNGLGARASIARSLRGAAVATFGVLLISCPPPPAIDTRPQVATPSFDVSSGTYGTELSVGISCATDGADIRYSTDGSIPSPDSGTLYRAPVPVIFSGTLKAVAMKEGMRDSEVAEANYVISKPPGQVPAPVFSLPSGTYNTELFVSIKCSMEGAQIRYTSDGSDPLACGTSYASPLHIAKPATILAAARCEGWLDSTVSSAEYRLRVAPPTFTPPGRAYPSMTKDVVISSTTPETSIRYTDDGSDPSPDVGTPCTDAVTVSGTMTLKAIAYREDWETSVVSSATYTTGKFTASGGEFGTSIARSTDDTAIVIGAPMEQNETGAVYLFLQLGNNCVQIARFTDPCGAEGDHLGCSVAISEDGSVVAAGATGADSGKGRALVFAKDPQVGLYGYAATLTDADGVAGDAFGFTVGMSFNGSIIAVGSAFSQAAMGAVHMFKRTTAWYEAQHLTALDGAPMDQFGSSVAVSAEGSTILVGAPADDSAQGAVYLFSRSDETWSQAQKIVAPTGTSGGWFGWSVDLSYDGSTIAVGASSHEYVSLFTNPGGGWSEAERLVPSLPQSSPSFGWSLSLSSNAGTVLVGAPYNTVGSTPNQGRAYVFEESGGTWTETRQLTAPVGAENQHCGMSVSVSLDGTSFVIGCPGDPDPESRSTGSAYQFE